MGFSEETIVVVEHFEHDLKGEMEMCSCDSRMEQCPECGRWYLCAVWCADHQQEGESSDWQPCPYCTDAY